MNLKDKSGLDISLDGNKIIPFENVLLEEPGLRRINDFDKVAKDEDIELTDEVAYAMYRGPRAKNDEQIFKDLKYRYDVTVIFTAPIGSEKMKTVGHYHPTKEGTDISYPEIYEVISGKAHYLMQKLKSGKIVDVKIIEAKAGDKVVIPPDYGHVTINPIQETLVMSNLVEKNFSSTYEEFEEKKGAIFYELTSGEIVKNENYEEAFSVTVISARDLSDPFGVQNDNPLYTDFIENPKKYDFLINPENYEQEFSEIFS